MILKAKLSGPSVLVMSALLLVALSATACGGSDGSDGDAADHNEQILDSAQSESASEDTVIAQLDSELDLAEYAGVDNTFSPDPGPCEPTDISGNSPETKPCCSVEEVYLGDELDLYADQEDVVLAPDESYAVQVGNFVDTDPAVCLEVVIAAVE